MEGMRRVVIGGAVLFVLAAIPAGAATTTTTQAPDCNLVRSKGAEFGSCVLVTTSIQAAPKVGSLGTVTFRLKAAPGVSGRARVRIETTPNITLKTLPSGFKAVSASTATLGVVGQRATSTVTVSSGATTTRSFTFSPSKSGYGSVRVIADSPVEVPGSGGSADAVFLTFDSKAGKLGLPDKLDDSARVLPKGTKVTVPQLEKLNKDAPALTNEEIQIKDGTWQGGQDQGQDQQQLKRARASRRAHAAADACVTGRVTVPDLATESGTGVAVAVGNLPVTAWDANSSVVPIGAGGDHPLSSGRTAADGSFRLCFNNAETGALFGTGTADVFVRLKLETANFMVGSRQMFGDTEMDVGNPWEWRTPTVENIPAGDRDLGILTVSDPLQAGAVAVFQMANQAWERTPGPCWDQEGSCDRKKIAWSPDSRTWPHYSPWPYSVIQLPWEAALDPHTVMHEIGHAVMNDVYEIGTDDLLGWMDSCPSPHGSTIVEPESCAWTEGFANWFGSHSMGAPVAGGFGFGNFIRQNFEVLEMATWTIDPSWNWATGDRAEMRVASALWDIEDGLGSPASDPYDRTNSQFTKLWAAFQAGKSTNFGEFVDRLQAAGLYRGYDLYSTLYGSTIDYANPFRTDLWVGAAKSVGAAWRDSAGNLIGWGGPHVVSLDPARSVTSGHRYRLLKPLASPQRTRDYVLAVRAKGDYWDGPIRVNSNTSETLPAAISGLGSTRYAWTWSTFDPGATTFRSARWTNAATVIRNDSFVGEFAYAILPYLGSSSSASMAYRPGYDVEMTDVKPTEATDPSSSTSPRTVNAEFPKGAVARAVSLPIVSGRRLSVTLDSCPTSPDSVRRASNEALRNVSMTMMDSTATAVRTANRLGGWVSPTEFARTTTTPSGGTATSVLTVNPRTKLSDGRDMKIMWFQPTVTTTAVLLLGLPADTGASTATRCVRVSVR